MKRLTPSVFVCVLSLAAAAHAQILTGDIIGTVKDESAALLPGVTLTLASPTALPGGPLTVVTDAKGEYRFTQLNPGVYALTATLSGFSTYLEDGLRVAVGGTIARDVTLKLGSVAETITVSGESPMVDPRKIGVAGNLNEKELSEIVTNHYGFHEYMKWAPGVVPSDPAGSSGSSSVLGSGTGENSFLYEGIMTNHPSSGGVWESGVTTNAAEEVQVVTLGASAEYQVAQGAVFNLVLKSGTNAFKGGASTYWHPDQLVSKPILLPCNCARGQTGFTAVRRRDFTADLGGPIVKDRLWFFWSTSYNDLVQSNPGADPNLAGGNFEAGEMTKVTWQINNNVKVKGLLQPEWWRDKPLPNAQSPFETVVTSGSHNGFLSLPTYALEMNATLSNKTLLTIRSTGWSSPHDTTEPLSGNIINSQHLNQITGIACCGVAQFGYNTIGRHGQAVKINRYIPGRLDQNVGVGLQLERAGYHIFNAYPSGVQYADLGSAPDQATFRSAFIQGARYTSSGVWAEDQMTIGGRLTLTFGVRFDHMVGTSPDEPAVNNQLQETGGTIKGLGKMFTWNVWVPRVGVNLKLTDDGKTIVRGQYGRAYRTIFLQDFINVHPGLSPVTLARYTTATGGYTTIVSVTDPLANIRVDPNIQAPFTNSYSIGLDRELVKNMGVGVTYVHKRGENQIGWRDIGGVYGTQTVTLANGQTLTVLPLLTATSTRLFQRTNGPGFFNRYNGLVFQLSKHLSHRWQANLSYTYSKAEGLITSGNTGQDPDDYINAAGRLATDRPNMLTATASYDVPKIDLQVASNFIHADGIPFAPQALVSLPQGRRSINIAPPDGTYRYMEENLLAFRITKSVFRRGSRQLLITADITNVLQDEAVNAIIGRNFFATTFGQPASWIAPRQMFLTATIRF